MVGKSACMDAWSLVRSRPPDETVDGVDVWVLPPSISSVPTGLAGLLGTQVWTHKIDDPGGLFFEKKLDDVEAIQLVIIPAKVQKAGSLATTKVRQWEAIRALVPVGVLEVISHAQGKEREG